MKLVLLHLSSESECTKRDMREGESESEQYIIITHLGNKGRAWNHFGGREHWTSHKITVLPS